MDLVYPNNSNRVWSQYGTFNDNKEQFEVDTETFLILMIIYS